MCGRFTLTRSDFEQLAAGLGARVRPDHLPLYRPRYNIAPTDPHWIVRTKYEERQLIPAHWGLVNSWAPDAKGAARQINARSESALTRPAFRDAFESRRCAAPADGFFEWAPRDGRGGTKEARRPYWYHAPDGGLLLFAGLYESWRDPESLEWRRTFTILTTDANETVAPVHDRMPVVLAPGDVEEWLFVPAQEQAAYAKTLRRLLRPAPPDTLIATAVSPRANSVQNDDPECLAPAHDREPAATPRLL
jgi:putative SOS response-associated peptidase YedK